MMKFLKVLSVLTMAFLVACGGGEEQTDQQQEQQMEAADDIRTVEVVGINSMKFAVESDAEGISVGEQAANENDLVLLESITATPGETLRIRLTTRSTMPATAMAHNWLLLEMNADIQAFADASAGAADNNYVAPEMTDMIIAQTGMAAGGETTEVTFTVPEQTGEYDYICTFPGHFAAGMTGKLVVQEEM